MFSKYITLHYGDPLFLIYTLGWIEKDKSWNCDS